MRENSNLTQWADGDSPLGKAEADIAAGRSFVCCEDDALLAVFVFEPEAEESAYRTIRGGAWPDDGTYGVKLFKNGRAIIKNMLDANRAKSIYTKYVTNQLPEKK